MECSFDVDTKFGEPSYFIWIDLPPELHVETLLEINIMFFINIINANTMVITKFEKYGVLLDRLVTN